LESRTFFIFTVISKDKTLRCENAAKDFRSGGADFIRSR